MTTCNETRRCEEKKTLQNFITSVWHETKKSKLCAANLDVTFSILWECKCFRVR